MSELHCTCTRLRKAARRITQAYDQHLAGTGFTANQLGIAAELARAGDVPMRALAAGLGMDPSTLTRNLRPLLQQAFVEIVGAPDRRQRVVRLTGAGRIRLGAALAAWQAAERAVARTLGQRDVAQLHSLLARLSSEAGAEWREHLQAAG